MSDDGTRGSGPIRLDNFAARLFFLLSFRFGYNKTEISLKQNKTLATTKSFDYNKTKLRLQQNKTLATTKKI